MYNEQDIEIIKNITLDKINNIESLILFGSYAKNLARENSDIDIVALLNIELPRQDKLKVLAELRWECSKLGYNIDLIIKTVDEFKLESSLPTLSQVIKNEGRELWKRA